MNQDMIREQTHYLLLKYFMFIYETAHSEDVAGIVAFEFWHHVNKENYEEN